MTVQMSALDEFVTRARTQNEQSHQQHLDSMRQYHTEVTQLQSDITSSIDQRTAGLQTYHAETTSNTNSLSETVTTFTAEAEEALQTMRTHVQETSLTDYTPTGQTPQKRDWSYPKDLPSTAPHATIIARSRGLPDPVMPESKTPGRSPRKSPRKASPNKPIRCSPTKGKVYTDTTDGELTRAISLENMTEPFGLKEINMNIVAGEGELMGGSKTISFSKSIGPGAGHTLPALKKPKITRSRTAAERGNRTVGVTGGEWLGRSLSER
jgi:kinesin family member 11